VVDNLHSSNAGNIHIDYKNSILLQRKTYQHKMQKISCFQFDPNQEDWRPYVGNKSILNTSALRIATFNVLMDCENFLSNALSRSQERFKKIVNLIDEISPDIIGLNEVTHSCLKFLLGNLTIILILRLFSFYFFHCMLTSFLLRRSNYTKRLFYQ
jgi:hypothetical protein